MSSEEFSYWPPGTQYPEEELILCSCASCGQKWKAHFDLGGFRLRCKCNAWVEVPARPKPNIAALPQNTADSSLVQSSPSSRSLSRQNSPNPQWLSGDVRRVDPDNMPLSTYRAPGTLADASATLQRRWTNRTLLEITLVMLAFFGPMLVVYLTTAGQERALYWPIASVVSSLLILTIGIFSRYYAFEGFRLPKPIYFLEAVGAAAIGVLLALAWIAFVKAVWPMPQSELGSLVERLGLPMTLFVIAICPGIFEEIAFRGLVQGRLSALFGNFQGILITGAAFALAHGGITLAFPVHVLLGIYLCWLRWRSESLLPGMLVHMLYNGTIVCLGYI